MIFLSKKCWYKNVGGVIIMAIGIGLLMAVLMPIWGWILFGGAALVYIGWYLSKLWR